MSFIVGSRYSNARCRRAARRRVAAAPDKFKAAALLLKRVAKAMQQKARAGEVTAAGSSCQKAPSAARRTWESRGSVTAQPHSRGRGTGPEGRSPGRSRGQRRAPGIAEKQRQGDQGVLTRSAKKCTTFWEGVKIITTS